MRVVVDTNIVFSAILNTNSKISQIILHPKTKLNFYSTHQLIEEIEEHKTKIQEISKYSDQELNRLISLITSRIRFINIRLIPQDLYLKAEQLTKEIDIDDTEFVALTTHIKGRLWSGDRTLQTGLQKKGWTKFVSTDELYKLIDSKK